MCIIIMPPPPFQSILFCTFLVSVCRQNDVCSISFDPFAGKLQNMGQWMPLKSSCSLLIFRSHGQRLRSSCWVIFCKCCLLNIFWPLCFDVAKLVQWLPLESRYSPFNFQVISSNVKIKQTILGQGQSTGLHLKVYYCKLVCTCKINFCWYYIS